MDQRVHEATRKSGGAYLDGCGGTGQGHKSASSFVFNRWTGGLQQVVDTSDEAGPLGGVSMANLTGKRVMVGVK